MNVPEQIDRDAALATGDGLLLADPVAFPKPLTVNLLFSAVVVVPVSEGWLARAGRTICTVPRSW